MKATVTQQGPDFQVANLNRIRTKFRPSEIHFQPSPTARNGCLEMRQPESQRLITSVKINVLLHLSQRTLLVEKW